MKTELTATVIDGRLDLDAAIDLPDETRVVVTVERLESDDAERLAAWERMKRRTEERPIHGGGEKFVRDDLYDC